MGRTAERSWDGEMGTGAGESSAGYALYAGDCPAALFGCFLPENPELCFSGLGAAWHGLTLSLTYSRSVRKLLAVALASVGALGCASVIRVAEPIAEENGVASTSLAADAISDIASHADLLPRT